MQRQLYALHPVTGLAIEELHLRELDRVINKDIINKIEDNFLIEHFLNETLRFNIISDAYHVIKSLK